MSDERELTVEQIGQVLGVSRTSIYRTLGATTTPISQAAPAPALVSVPADPAATIKKVGGVAAAAPPVQQQTSVDGAPAVLGRPRGRSRWFVVQADPADPEHGPVAVLSGHTSQQAVTTALARASSRSSSGPGEGARAVLQVRAAEQISSRLVWDGRAGRGVVQPGPPT